MVIRNGILLLLLKLLSKEHLRSGVCCCSFSFVSPFSLAFFLLAYLLCV